MLKKELIYYFKSYRFISIVVANCLIMFLIGREFAGYFDEIRVDPNFMYDSFGFQLFERSIYDSSKYFIFVSIIPSLIYSFTYLKEKNTNFGVFQIVRLGYKKYFFNKIICNIVFSFFTQLISMIVYLAYCLIAYGYNVVDYGVTGETQLFYINPVKWSVIVIMVFSLYVTIFSLISMGVSFFIKKYYLIYPFSVLFMIFIVVILNLFNSIGRSIGINIDIIRFMFPLTFVDTIQYDFNSSNIPILLACIIFYLLITLYTNYKLYAKDIKEYLE